MNIVHTWLLLGATGAVTNCAYWWYARQGRLGPAMRARAEDVEKQAEAESGTRWLLPFAGMAIFGFIFPPMPLVGLLRLRHLSRTRQICTDECRKYSFDEAMAERGWLISGGIPEEKSFVGKCHAGNHYHVWLTSDMREQALRLKEGQTAAEAETRPPPG